MKEFPNKKTFLSETACTVKYRLFYICADYRIVIKLQNCNSAHKTEEICYHVITPREPTNDTNSCIIAADVINIFHILC
jgi:hypothetical protein